MVEIAFRVDGGKNIGLGHIMRSLALAKQFSKDIRISFISKRNSKIKKIMKQEKFELINLDPDLNYQTEIKKLKQIIIDYKIDILITDSYDFDQNYLVEMKKVVDKLVTIHDFAPFIFPSDIVINGNVYAQELAYQSLSGNTEFLLGADYTLLRNEFIDLPKKKVNKEVKSILITFGGSDSLNLTPKVLKTINKMNNNVVDKKNLHIDVVIGPAFTHISKILKTAENSEIETTLHFNLNKMSRLMLKSDLAISAGGSTLYELAATGVPTLVVLQAKNQSLLADYLEEEGVIFNLGFWKDEKKARLKNRLIDLSSDYELRLQMSQNGQNLIDGKGCIRCVKKILS